VDTNTLCGIAFVIGLLLLIGTLQNAKSHNALKCWSEENGYKLVEMDRCGLNTGPFEVISKYSPPVYKLTLEDEQGRQRIAWVCRGEGHPRLGKLTPRDNVLTIIWDEEYRAGYYRRI
jgi:hypothetical protein